MKDKTLKRNIETAGGWFVGEYAALILSKSNELEFDKDFNNEFIREVFRNHGIEALEYVIDSDSINNEEPKAVKMAKVALREIK